MGKTTEQMAFQMVDCDKGKVAGGGQFLGISNALLEGRGETGTDCHGESVELWTTSFMQCAVDNFGEPLVVESAGDVWHCTSPVGMVAGLAAHHVTENSGAASDGGTSVVEAGFDSEDGRVLHNLVLYLERGSWE